MAWSTLSESEKHKQFRKVDAPENKILELLVQRERNELSILLTLTPEAYQTLYNQFEFHPEFGFSEKRGVFMTDNGYKCALTIEEGTEKNILGRFLDEMIIFEPEVSDILSAIKTFCRFLDVKVTHQELQEIFEKNGYEAALKVAQKKYEEGVRNVFVFVAKICFDKNQVEQGIATLRKIPENDFLEYFEAAKILLKLNQDLLALEYLFKAGNDPVVQEIRDKIFWKCTHKSAGVKSEEVLVRGIRLNDPRTLIAITHKIKELKVEMDKYSAEKIQLDMAFNDIQTKLSAFPPAKT